MNENRIRQLNTQKYTAGPIVYWMSREQRVEDNWALLYAQKLSHTHNAPLLVMFNLAPHFLGGSARNYHFKLEGLKQVEKDLAKLNIPFFITVDEVGTHTSQLIIKFCDQHNVGALVTDFSPLREPRAWVDGVRKKILVPFYGVDAHNIVPCWIASPKLEFAAYTFRPKIHTLLQEYWEDFPKVTQQKVPYTGSLITIDWNTLIAARERSEYPAIISGGSHEAHKTLTHFLEYTLPHYARDRNDPNIDAQSNFSPYFHYGHIAPARVAYKIVSIIGKPIHHILAHQKNKAKVDTHAALSLEDNAAAYLEELIVRRELSDNFCFYNDQYDSTDGFADWAKKSHAIHSKNKREFVYTKIQFEHGNTHDTLWNACQLQMVKSGKMHGYMRMYWAKKILEWTKSPEDAMKIAVYLNDTYELDGRDPNGYAGIAWSIGGVHDRAWFVRPVYGQIRYMNRNGCKAKFDIDSYIKKWL